MEYKKPKIIAEIGCNHMGDFSIAKELVCLAKEAGADVAKFQKRHPRTLLTKKQYDAPHPNPKHAYGETYGAHREFLEFTVEQHKDLKKYCESIGIEYSTSVWDVVSAREIISLNPSLIKIPSAINTNFEVLKLLRDKYTGDIHASLGMTTREEEERLVQFFEETDAAKKRLVLYSCTSGYPVDFSDVSLLEITRLKQQYGSRVKDIGFSGHHNGIAIDIAAYTLGARWIERHFTKNRTWKGTDHSASLEPQGLFKLIRNLGAAHESLTYKRDELLPVELIQRKKLKHIPAVAAQKKSASRTTKLKKKTHEKK